MTRMDQEEEEGITLVDLWNAVRKHMVSAVVTLVVVVAVVAAYTFTRTPEYTATAQLFATYQRISGDDGGISEFNSGATYIQSQIQTYPQLVKTESVPQPVIDDLGLDMSVDALAQKVTASNPDGTMLVDIDVVDADAQAAADIANGVAESMRDQISAPIENDDGGTTPSPVDLDIVQQAYAPESPSSPNVPLYLAAGLVAGLVLGCCVAIVRDMLDRRVRQSSDATAIIDAPVLGTVTRSDRFAANRPVIVGAGTSSEAEEMRRLRVNLSFINANGDDRSNVIVVTSSTPAEGKSTIAINLAVAFAEQGSRVLLIDADVRHASVGSRLNIEGEVGLTQLLTGQASSADVIQKYWRQNLHVLPAGKQTMSPSVLLNSLAMSALLRQTSKAYNYVIIDTAPMQVANDAAVLAKEGTSLVMVVGFDVAEKQRLRAVKQELDVLGVRIMGVVFNLAEEDRQKYGAYYYYGGDEDNERGKHRHEGRKAKQ